MKHIENLLHPSQLFTTIYSQEGYQVVGRNMNYKFHIDTGAQIIYVCFQHSQGVSDWLYNILALPSRMEPYEGCGWWVHKGFATVWRSGNYIIMNQLLRLVGMPQMANFDIVFCGFSHGGPLAMLAAENWYRIMGQRCQCITFGSPKLAWGDAARSVLNRAMILTNWINRADAITALPFEWWGFLHVLIHLVNVRRIPILSLFNVWRHHQIYNRPEIYPEKWRRAA